MTDNINLIKQDLLTHAGSIGDMLTVVGQAQGASNHIKMGNEAYGELCAWLPPFLSGRHSEMDSLLTLAKSNLEALQTLMHTLTGDFSGQDIENATELDTAAGG